MPYLAKMVAEFGDKKLAKEIADNYTENYLFHLSLNELLTEEHIKFLRVFTKSFNRQILLDFVQQQEKD